MVKTAASWSANLTETIFSFVIYEQNLENITDLKKKKKEKRSPDCINALLVCRL